MMCVIKACALPNNANSSSPIFTPQLKLVVIQHERVDGSMVVQEVLVVDGAHHPKLLDCVQLLSNELELVCAVVEQSDTSSRGDLTCVNKVCLCQDGIDEVRRGWRQAWCRSQAFLLIHFTDALQVLVGDPNDLGVVIAADLQRVRLDVLGDLVDVVGDYTCSTTVAGIEAELV